MSIYQDDLLHTQLSGKKIADHPTAASPETGDLPPMSEATTPFLSPPIPVYLHCIQSILRKADIRNPLSLLAHERSRFATCVQFIIVFFIRQYMNIYSHIVLFYISTYFFNFILRCIFFCYIADTLNYGKILFQHVCNIFHRSTFLHFFNALSYQSR